MASRAVPSVEPMATVHKPASRCFQHEYTILAVDFQGIKNLRHLTGREHDINDDATDGDYFAISHSFPPRLLSERFGAADDVQNLARDTRLARFISFQNQ